MAALFAALDHAAVNDKAQWQNDLLTRLEAVLRPCAWHHIHAVPQAGDDPNRMPARHVVKRWTPAQRARFADPDQWRKEKRMTLRRVAAGWMRDLATMRATGRGKIDRCPAIAHT